jgi:hypothetical protein
LKYRITVKKARKSVGALDFVVLDLEPYHRVGLVDHFTVVKILEEKGTVVFNKADEFHIVMNVWLGSLYLAVDAFLMRGFLLG